ncbi:EXLDI protein [Streptosporangiaceae bacterium NEAU-GS5]|nr:EXLDI protein [Streptosporangiaceae bacterium NEAU-GS5]
MPNKTIYVSDEDLPLYQRAQELAGGNLSRAISAALRRYIDLQEATGDGYEEITVRVGRGTRKHVRFVGYLLAEWGNNKADYVEIIRVYRTRKQKFVVHRERTTSWRLGDESLFGWRSHLGLNGQTWGTVKGEATVDVVDALEDLREQLPPEFLEMLADIGDEPVIDDLDI